ncbi:MAG: hypothetical protein CSA62_08400 [Planctomycetota bacterium]|nr:MAG: hypothetical protein CSA62_08400 [Planctomycetota bacterium]
MNSLRLHVERGNRPKLLRWGKHEGIRGAEWIELDEGGQLLLRRYLPNAKGKSSAESLGERSRERFGELVGQVMAIPEGELATLLQQPPMGNALSLACCCEGADWEIYFAPHLLEGCPYVRDLAARFQALLGEGSE